MAFLSEIRQLCAESRLPELEKHTIDFPDVVLFAFDEEFDNQVARIGGLGSLVQQTAAEQQSRCPVHTLALPDEWLYHGKRREQLHQLGLDAAGLRSHLKRLLAR